LIRVWPHHDGSAQRTKKLVVPLEVVSAMFIAYVLFGFDHLGELNLTKVWLSIRNSLVFYYFRFKWNFFINLYWNSKTSFFL